MIPLLLHAIIWFGLWRWRVARNSKATPTLPHRTDDIAAWPHVTIFVPARNEQRSIKQCLRSLLAQNYPGRFNVICANDHSTDNTGAILARLRHQHSEEQLTIFDVPDLPPGWMGKCHALFRAVRLNSKPAEIYLFTDADCIHRKDALRRAVGHLLRERADLLAIAPHLHCIGLWENVTLPLLLHQGIIMINPANLNDPGKKEIAGIGAFTLLRRSMYEKWGGHRAIRGEVIDDMAMGMMTKKHGGRLLLVTAPRTVQLRMYTGLRSIVQGFEKNMHTAVGGHIILATLAAAGLIVSHLIPVVMMLLALLDPAYGVPLFLLALLLHLATGWAIYGRTKALVSPKPALVILLYPLGALLAAFIMVRSALHATVEGEVRWRGRRLPLPKQKTKMF